MRTLLIGLVSLTALAQTASFEAVTIRPAGPEEAGISGGDGRNGVLKIWNMTLRGLVGNAYSIPGSLVIGGPPWIGEAGYDILRESRTVSGYTLTVAKGGVLAKVSDPGRHSSSNGGPGFIDSAGNGWGALAKRLTVLLGIRRSGRFPAAGSS